MAAAEAREAATKRDLDALKDEAKTLRARLDDAKRERDDVDVSEIAELRRRYCRNADLQVVLAREKTLAERWYPAAPARAVEGRGSNPRACAESGSCGWDSSTDAGWLPFKGTMETTNGDRTRALARDHGARGVPGDHTNEARAVRPRQRRVWP